MRKVLILGGSGLIGKALISELNKFKDFETYATYFERSISISPNRSFKLDIENSDTINGILESVQPNIIISCLRGNYEKQLVLHIKTAEYLKNNDGRLYFCSTTNVFDNDLSKPHYEDDLTNSNTEYGQFKIKCEKTITEILQDSACILRLPQVWGKDSPRLKELLELLGNNERIIIYPKLIVNTNTNVNIAKMISYILQHNLKGIFHLAVDDMLTYKELYNELIIGLGFNNANLHESFVEKGYFAILSKRNKEFPEHLRLTNRSVISYLTNQCADIKL